MPYLALADVLNLPNLNREAVATEEIYLSDSMNVDPLTCCMRDAVTRRVQAYAVYR